MDYNTGICTLDFKPDHSDLGQWTCKFTIPSEYAEEELGSASLVLLNSLAGMYIVRFMRESNRVVRLVKVTRKDTYVL